MSSRAFCGALHPLRGHSQEHRAFERSLSNVLGMVNDLDDTAKCLIRITEAIPPLSWQYAGDVIVHHHSRGDIPVSARCDWGDSGGRVTVTDRGRSFFAMGVGGYGTFAADTDYVSITASDSSWQIPNALYSAHRITSGEADEVEFRFSQIVEGKPGHDLEILLFACAPRAIFPDPLPVPEGMFRKWFLERGLFTEAFGCRVLLRYINLDAPEPPLAVALSGPRVSQQQRVALQILLWFILGHEICPVAEFTFDRSATPTSKTLFAKDVQGIVRPHPAIDIRRADVVKYLGIQFSTLAERMHKGVFVQGVPFDVAIDHLTREMSGRLDLQARDIALALDTVIEAPPFAAPIAPEAEFDSIQQQVNTAIEAACGDRDELAARMKSLVALSKDRSFAERRRRFWAKCNIALTKDEMQALDLRNPMSHKGYIHVDPTGDEFEQLYKQVGVARSVVNRAFLSLLGYRGDAFVYPNGDAAAVEPWADEPSASL